MAAEVTIPGTRRKVNKWVAGGIAVGGLGAVWLLLRNRSSAGSSSASAASGTVTDPSTGQTYPADGTDPATGETYAAEIAQYGSVSAADAAGSGLYGQGGNLYGGGYGGGYGTGSGTTTGTSSGTGYADNATWTQAAIAGLSDIGFSGMQVAEALGLYLDRAPLTADEARIVQTAVGEFGPPPNGTYQIIQQPGGNTGGSGGTTSAAKAPTGAPTVTVGTSANDLTAAWAAVPGATKYNVVVQGTKAGTTQATVETTHAVFSVATSGDTGTVKVRAGNSAGWGPFGAARSFTFAAPKPATPAAKTKTGTGTTKDGKPAVKQ